MAFYTSRVDNEGNELERRPSVRSIGRSTYSSLSASMSSSSTFIAPHSDRSLGPNSSVRYLNPAAFIEKSSTDECSESVASNDMTIKSSSSRIVPSLDIHSEDSFETNQEYIKMCPKVSSHSEAFDTWLSAKKNLITFNSNKRRQLEEEKIREKKERQKLAQQKFDEWMEHKIQQQQQRQQLKMYEEQEKGSSGSSVSGKRAQISAEEASSIVKEWKKKKFLEEKQRREMERAEEERRKQWEEERHRMSTEAWKTWVAEAASKPKPVPLNRGIFTLRGTISDIYVNPNEWQTVSSENE